MSPLSISHVIVFVAESNVPKNVPKGMEVCPVRRVQDALDLVF